MKNLAICFALLISTNAVTVDAQESHVHMNYQKAIDRTIVTSDLMYVVNTPSQFMQIQLVGRYPGKAGPTQAPDRIYINFYSYSPNPVYQTDLAHSLKVKADDKIIDFGLLSYSKVDGRSKNDKDKTNPKPLSSNLDLDISIPPIAQVAKTTDKGSLTVELMSVKDLSLVGLNNLASSNDLVMKLGNSVFRLTPVHLAILREFTEALTPANFNPSANAVTPAKISPGVPSDENKATLGDTLKWLSSEMEHESATKDIVIPRKFEPIDFKTCRISYRIVPLVRHSPVSNTLVYAIMEYQMDLRDLNPEGVEVSDLGEYASVRLVTRDYQAKVRILKHDNNGGITGRTLEDGLSESASINLKSKEAAVNFKAAVVHAINLCQNQQ